MAADDYAHVKLRFHFLRVESDGIMATDEAATLWRTFGGGALPYRPTPCPLCGQQMTAGWQRVYGQQAICSAHVELVGLP